MVDLEEVLKTDDQIIDRLRAELEAQKQQNARWISFAQDIGISLGCEYGSTPKENKHLLEQIISLRDNRLDAAIKTGVCEICKEKSVLKCDALNKEIQEVKEIVFDLFCQACTVRDSAGEYKFDHMFHGTYEYVQKDLIKWGLVKEDHCLRKV